MRVKDKQAAAGYLKKLELIRSGSRLNLNETFEERQAAIERAKKDVAYCVRRYFPHYATAECAPFQIKWANKLLRNKRFKGFAKWGRGLAKSVWNNVIIPFWLWLNEGKKYFVLVGPNAKRAVRLLEDLRAEFEGNPQIIADFGEQKNPGSWDEHLWITKGGFIGQALGFGEPCRGLRVAEKRPDHYNVDDLETRQTVKNESRQDEMVEWVEQELLPTMDGNEERLVFSNNWFAPVMFLRKLSEKHPDWYVHEVKAYCPITYTPTWSGKYGPDYYRTKEREMGVLAALAEYNHEAKAEGKIFKSEQIQWADLPSLNRFKIIVGHWDVAYAGTATADYNAVRIWGLLGNDFYLIGCFAKRSKMRDAVVFMCDFEKRLPATVRVHWQYESQFWNGELERTIKEVKAETGVKLPISKVDTPRVRKYDRILQTHVYYQNSRVFYGAHLKASADTQTGLNQLFGIEPGYSGNDDVPDADEQAFKFLDRHITSGGSAGGFRSGKMRPKNEAI